MELLVGSRGNMQKTTMRRPSYKQLARIKGNRVSLSAAAIDFGVMDSMRSEATFFFFCFLTSPSGHKWQKRHWNSFWQPLGFQYHAHGRHTPLSCKAEPSLGMPTRCAKGSALHTFGTACASWASGRRQPGGLGSESVGLGLWTPRSEPEAVVVSASEASPREKSPKLNPGAASVSATLMDSQDAAFGVSRPRRSINSFDFFRDLSSPSGQRWQ